MPNHFFKLFRSPGGIAASLSNRQRSSAPVETDFLIEYFFQATAWRHCRHARRRTFRRRRETMFDKINGAGLHAGYSFSLESTVADMNVLYFKRRGLVKDLLCL
jgi:hypothetical protein